MIRIGPESVCGGPGDGVAAVHFPHRGQGDRRIGDRAVRAAVALPQRHVHGPVVAALPGEFAGSVQRVNDPDPVGLQPFQVVVGLFAEHRVARTLGVQPLEQQRIGLAVALVAEQPRVVETHPIAHRQQQLSRLFGKVGGQRGVAHGLRGHGSSISDGPARFVTIQLLVKR